MNKLALSIISLSFIACGVVPEFPEVWQCVWAGEPRAFFCVNTKTKERRKVSAGAPEMRGAQCLSADDYKKSEAWVAGVKQLAENRCRN